MIRSQKRIRKQRKSDEEIRELYFKWLYDQVDRRNPDPSHKSLARLLHQREFYDLIPNDDNRGTDGLKLRDKFSDVVDYFANDYDFPCLDGPCTVLEMLIALSMKIQEIEYDRRKGNQTARWFWEMVANLNLKPYLPTEFDARESERYNDDVITILLERKYTPNGNGGLFPLKDTNKDQRKVEIWYQLMEYLDENYPEV